uniref:Uncharacterized protein n=1 Tax=Rhizophora mucronata TaxID=61149 RepID=A0A2P2Q377_RHIMU
MLDEFHYCLTSFMMNLKSDNWQPFVKQILLSIV